MSDGSKKIVSIAEDYSPFPAGRFRSDGPFSGEKFRDEILVPALKSFDLVEVKMDGAFGFGSSFLEEAFGGLVRRHAVSATEALRRIRIDSSDESLVEEVMGYIKAKQ